MADHKAKHGREHDAKTGHEKRVEQPHEEHAAVCIGFAIGNERLIDNQIPQYCRESRSRW